MLSETHRKQAEMLLGVGTKRHAKSPLNYRFVGQDGAQPVQRLRCCTHDGRCATPLRGTSHALRPTRALSLSSSPLATPSPPCAPPLAPFLPRRKAAPRFAALFYNLPLAPILPLTARTRNDTGTVFPFQAQGGAPLRGPLLQPAAG